VNNVNVRVGVLVNDGIGSFGSWNMEMAIVFKIKYLHIN
jgi:hypothetical protein